MAMAGAWAGAGIAQQLGGVKLRKTFRAVVIVVGMFLVGTQSGAIFR